MDENKTMSQPNPQDGGEKTFTQEEVNRIVGERLAKAKNSGETDLAKREQELARRELTLNARELLNEKGLPAQLLDALNCANEETIRKSVEIIETILKERQATAHAPNEVRTVSFGVASNACGGVNIGSQAIRKAMRLP